MLGRETMTKDPWTDPDPQPGDFDAELEALDPNSTIEYHEGGPIVVSVAGEHASRRKSLRDRAPVNEVLRFHGHSENCPSLSETPHALGTVPPRAERDPAASCRRGAGAGERVPGSAARGAGGARRQHASRPADAVVGVAAAG